MFVYQLVIIGWPKKQQVDVIIKNKANTIQM